MWRCSRRALLLCLLAGLVVAGLPQAAAVVCSSYMSAADCNGKVTSSGRCGWDAGRQTCRVVAPLPEGFAAVTSVEEEPVFSVTSVEPVEPAGGAMAPEAEEVTLRGMLVSQPPLPTSASTSQPQPQPVCVDTPTPEGYTCQQQRDWGKCSERWMAEGGFCRRTCNLCSTSAGAGAAQGQAAGEQGTSSVPADIVETAPQSEQRATSPPGQFCRQPPAPGPCRAAIRSWYWDAPSQSCRPFLYGGCEGNDNRFDSFNACQAVATANCPSS